MSMTKAELDACAMPQGSLRIAFVTPKFYPERGGSETWSFNVLRSLAKLGHTVEAIAGFAPGLQRQSFVEGITVYRPGPQRKDGAIGRARWMRGFAPEVVTRLRAFQPDVVLGHHSGLALASIIARRMKLPSVGVVHDVRGVSESCKRAGLATGVARVALLERSLRVIPTDAFITPSRTTASHVARLTGARRPVKVVPVGADHGVLKKAVIKRISNPARIIFVGRLVPEKGAADLISAVSMLRNELEVSIVGNGPELERLQKQAASLPVCFKGWVDDETLDAEIRRADVLVLPSTQEGWGLVLTESAARGVPYVAYDIPAVREQHSLLHAGLLVAPSARALANGLASLLADQVKHRSLAQAGVKATELLRWETAARKVVSVIQETMRAHV
ncbi:MAG: glycosyltransferase family 4 protein [Actinomycetota bacterium]